MKALCFALLLVCASAAYIDIPYFNSVTVDTWSGWYFITASEAPNFTTTLSITASNSTIQIQNSQLALTSDPPVRTLSFRFKPLATGAYYLTFQVDSSLQFSLTSSIRSFASLYRPDPSIETIPDVYVGLPSEPIQISLTYPSANDLTFTPTHSLLDSSRITFTPTTVTIPAGSLTASFTYVAKNDFYNAYITWVLSGDDASLYNPPLTGWTSNTFSSYKRNVYAPDFSQVVVANKESNSLSFYVPQRVNGSLTVTPVASDTTFTPTSVQLADVTQQASFTFNSTAIESSKPVYFYLSGDAAAAYNQPSYTTMSVTKKNFLVDTPTSFVFNVKSKLSIRIYTPATADMTVSLFATHLQFSPATVTFSGEVTAISVDITTTNIGSDKISFLISGAEADNYNLIPSINVYVDQGDFFGIGDGWYVPNLWVGQESDPIPLWITVPPTNKIVVTPTAPDMVFKPATLSFDKNNLRQTFTITPVKTNAYTNESVDVQFLVSGADSPVYNTESFFGMSVVVQRRNLQFVWSSHLSADEPALHLGKTYYVWATASYMASGESVTVTPVNPYITFDPATLSFSSGSTHIKFKATVNAVVGATEIDYIIEGNAGGYFGAYSQIVSTAIRSLTISSAALGFDDRSPYSVASLVPGYTANFMAALSANHVKSIVLSTSVIPDDSLTITPKSPHVDFSPASITLNADDKSTSYTGVTLNKLTSYSATTVSYTIQANFTVKAKSAGVHMVYFELSGGDGKYYDIPDQVALASRKYTDNNANPSAATGMEASLSLLVFVLLMSLALVL